MKNHKVSDGFPRLMHPSSNPGGGRIPNPEGPLPPLPEPIPIPDPQPVPFPEPRARLPEPIPHEFRHAEEFWPRFRSLREGCYLIRYSPFQTWPATLHYDGTMRVEREGRNTIASGDLYLHRYLHILRHLPQLMARRLERGDISLQPELRSILRVLPFEPNPANGIPIFARSRYRYYLCVTQILEWATLGNSFTLGFEMHRFDHSTNTWSNEGAFTARMTWTTAPPGYPSSSDYLTGQVKNSNGTVVGNLTMGWVSEYFRRAVIEIDRVSHSETPVDNGGGIDWRGIFEEVGWDIEVDVSDTSVTEPDPNDPDGFWSNAELHQEMLNWRDSSNLDVEWRYHLLCVRRLSYTSRGVMYDAYGGDSNNIPREGAGISSHWMIPNTATWGLVSGLRFGTATGPYFRTAVHEIGHAQGLYHNTVDNGIMNTTGTIAGNAVPPEQFPENVQWSHASDDQKRLRHMPDIWVRPGGFPFGQSYNTAPISPDDMCEEAPGLEVQVSALLDTVPLGAPVRVYFSLVNNTDQSLPVPASLSLKAGHVKGSVIDSNGTVRVFQSLILCIEEDELRLLEPGVSMAHSLTLLRGPQGALFPCSGVHKVVVEVSWDIRGIKIAVRGETSVMVTPPLNEAHARAAHILLSTPDSLLTLAIGGDHLKEGVEAIKAGIDDPVLRPHYAIVEAKRVGNRFGKRKADFKAAFQMIDDKTVLTGPEIRRAAQIAKKAGAEAESELGKKMVKAIKDKIDRVIADDEIVMMVRDL